MSSDSRKENQENDLLDMVFGTTVATVFFMGIAAAGMVISMLVK
ncbi:hypothetical protein GCM10011571_29400 [Marinithermofilum abyssi]|jgi:hypothetical protein|uniref:YqzM family protein n=1 Tax=Marinithermofilum abyssi TaxID=1571185 RepID=A0A8J2YAZ9_9BACL|nr:hypothetical protein [Marinithermofilum abyssi]GGE25319.1 hypothetical protein GCM10011571_29400 [Marinithermofilum abyssi]